MLRPYFVLFVTSWLTRYLLPQKFRQLFSRLLRAHQRLADQKNVNAKLLDAADLIETINSAFAHDWHAGRNERRQALGGCKAYFKGVEIPVVDADECRSRRDRRFQFLLCVHFD